MAKNAEEQDILTEILNGVEEDVVEGLDSLYEIIRLESADTPEAEDTADALKKKPPQKAPKKTPKKKTSHYLTEVVFEELSDAKLDLRAFLPDVPKSNVTKSNIVNIAVKTILDEYKEKGLKSTLIQKLLSEKKKRERSK